MKKKYYMKPIVDLMDNSINKLEKLIPKEHSSSKKIGSPEVHTENNVVINTLT